MDDILLSYNGVSAAYERLAVIIIRLERVAHSISLHVADTVGPSEEAQRIQR